MLWVGSCEVSESPQPGVTVMAKKETIGQDSAGRYRRRIGNVVTASGKIDQQTFRLGRDEEDAKAANLRLEQLWECVVKRWKKLKSEQATNDPCPLWDELTLSIGRAIAAGQTSCELPPVPGTEGLPITPAFAMVQALRLAQTQKDFPMIALTLPESTVTAATAAEEKRASVFQQQLDQTRETLTALGKAPSGHGLHEALDSYSSYLAAKYNGQTSERTHQLNVSLIKRHTPDAPLSSFDADRIDTWLSYWCSRPISSETKKPLALTTCRNLLIALRAFLRWLNRSSSFSWSLPGGYIFPRCRINKTEADRVKKRSYFKTAELVTLWKYAKPWDRALMLLALNCGFSKKEISTLQVGEIVTRKGRKFIARDRRKTDVYAEWVLWPETVEALEYLKQFRNDRSGNFAVVNTSGGTMEGKTKGKRNENQVIKNHWDNLLKRVKEDCPDFHKLPFKHLRKTGATFIRHLKIQNAAEVSSMFLSHGEKSDSKDTLLSVYTTRPWKKLHRAILKLRRKLLPMLTSVSDPWEFVTFRTTPGTTAKVLALRKEGKGYKAIASEVGLHEMTVGKICRKHRQIV